MFRAKEFVFRGEEFVLYIPNDDYISPCSVLFMDNRQEMAGLGDVRARHSGARRGLKALMTGRRE